MSNARDNIKQNIADEARATLRTVISLDGFLALKGEARAARWRMLDHGAKFQLCAQAIVRQTGRDWTDAEIAEAIALYDEKYSAGPVEKAIEGALERLAIDNAQHARAAETKADRAYFRRASTAYTNALVQYKAGIRPQLLDSGAWLIPSSTPGKSAHIVSMDGDWTCNCCAGASMHWPIALVIALEGAQEDMQRSDDGPDADADRAAAQLAERLDATAQILDTMRQAQGRTVLPEAKVAPQDAPRRLGVRLAQARRRSAYFTSAFYLEAA